MSHRTDLGVPPGAEDFFRQATLRICSSLEVEHWLAECLRYLRQFVPADAACLTRFRAEAGRQLCLAKATVVGAERVEMEVPVTEEARQHFSRGRVVRVAARARDLPPSRAWIERGLLDADAAILSLRLTVKGQIVGSFILTANRSDSFTPAHAELVTALREPLAIALSNSLAYRELARLKDRLFEDNRFLEAELRQASGHAVVGQDYGLRGVMEMVRHVAPLTSPVLLLGETGTGKEVIAGAIHNLSPRHSGPFVKVNCGAIPENLMDSELFGHERGAFTGALARKRGRFERAHGGTIFLDEVGELMPQAQVRLLRVLQDREIERVGGVEPVRVDLRVIAATHRDLPAMVAEGRFREDLYFRLKVFPVLLPPLRERKGDIASLVDHFVRHKAREMGLGAVPPLAPGALEPLLAYDWPGNVRELENTVERALILCRGALLRFDPRVLAGASAQAGRTGAPLEHTAAADSTLDSVVAAHIRSVLEATDGRVAGPHGAACLLGVNPSTLRKKMRKLGIAFGRGARHRPA
ncbi:MAG: sigma 54-interacting transcriptional regulator [Polyangiaceae bacterium]|nr:sigma 54-interacting transcriptional regulator [Polyangiaceae bacterium]